MALQLVKLASQGRAFDSTRAFTQKEHEAVLTLMRECDIDRTVAADYVRNGICTVEAYKTAVEAEFKPKSLEELHANVMTEHREKVAEELGIEIPDLSDDEPDVNKPADGEDTEEETEEEEEDSEEEEEVMPSREELEKQATELGVKFSSRMKDETIWKSIKKATS